MKRSQKIYLPFKRFIDIIGSIIGILLCAALLWWWVIIINAFVTKGHPFFVQKRVGKNDRLFPLIKFQSMRNDVNHEQTSAFADTDSMTTGFGKFLRASSIDETAQLLDIFLGYMSFIGPRPLIDKHEDHITVEIRRLNGAIKIKPGISGWAQIHGRTSVGPEDKGNYDGYYYEHFSFWMDTKIFFQTIAKLFGAGKGK